MKVETTSADPALIDNMQGVSTDGDVLYKDADGCTFVVEGKVVIYLEGDTIFTGNHWSIEFPVRKLHNDEKVVLTND